jgi:hypothetical protein
VVKWGDGQWGVGGSSLVGRTDEKGIEHDSFTPRVRKMFITMRYSPNFNDNRCSKPSMPRNTATQVSCTTSSACASVATYIRAVRCRGAWYRSSNHEKAPSSP